MTNNQAVPGQTFNIDVSSVADMECVCGNKFFTTIFTVKFVSGLMNPSGQDVGAKYEKMWCINPECGLIIGAAMPNEQVKKYAKSAHAQRLKISDIPEIIKAYQEIKNKKGSNVG
jgi:hypothetical protein